MALSVTDCFFSPEFCSWWDAVHIASNYRCWDESPMLDVLVDAFNAGKTPQETAQIGIEEEAMELADVIASNPFS